MWVIIARAALHPAEEATLRAFVIPAKRHWLLALFGSPKRRNKARDALNHFTAWDARFAQLVDPSTDVLALLRTSGAPLDCHVMSDSPKLDGRDMPLSEAVSECETFQFASVLCCVPGELAFFFDEIVGTPRDRLLLRRPAVVRENMPAHARGSV